MALDDAKGINNGEPFLHAMWIGKLALRPGEAVCHIGAGTGYYTAVLARLVSPAAPSPLSNSTKTWPSSHDKISKPMAM
uniref:hypothetical protein n=1 Tax=Pectobacterium cacticida TaxID=69221 RepID=UPI0036729C69